MDFRTAIYRFCNYQERSQYEVKERLYELGANSEEAGLLIIDLIDVGLLNEERFAMAYVRGKFSLKHWGKIKILQGLKRHRISEYLRNKAIKSIDANAYFAEALRLASKKMDLLSRERTETLREGKVYRYLLQKGYESSIIKEAISVAAEEAANN